MFLLVNAMTFLLKCPQLSVELDAARKIWIGWVSPVLNRTSCGTKIDESKHTRFLFFPDTKTTATFWVLYAFISRYHSRQMTKTKCSIVSVLSFAYWNFKITCTILFLKVTIYVAEFQQLKQEMFLLNIILSCHCWPDPFTPRLQ